MFIGVSNDESCWSQGQDRHVTPQLITIESRLVMYQIGSKDLTGQCSIESIRD